MEKKAKREPEKEQKKSKVEAKPLKTTSAVGSIKRAIIRTVPCIKPPKTESDTITVKPVKYTPSPTTDKTEKRPTAAKAATEEATTKKKKVLTKSVTEDAPTKKKVVKKSVRDATGPHPHPAGGPQAITEDDAATVSAVTLQICRNRAQPSFESSIFDSLDAPTLIAGSENRGLGVMSDEQTLVGAMYAASISSSEESGPVENKQQPAATVAATAAPTAMFADGEPVIVDGDEICRVIQLIGVGGMGEIYKVTADGHTEALKTVKIAGKTVEERSQLFLDLLMETRTLLVLGYHPNVVQVRFAMPFKKNDLYSFLLLMEYVEGKSLQTWMEGGRQAQQSTVVKEGKMYSGPEDLVLKRLFSVAIQTARGMKYIHEKGIIHQDFKPGNVLVKSLKTSEGSVCCKITDYGGCIRFNSELKDKKGTSKASKAKINSASDESISTPLSSATPAYWSPEQAAGYTSESTTMVNRRTDIYSWAISIIHLYATTRFWSQGHEGLAIYEEYMNKTTDETAHTDVYIMPADLLSVVRQCLEPLESNRPRTFDIILSTLESSYANLYGKRVPAMTESSVTVKQNQSKLFSVHHNLGVALYENRMFEDAVNEYKTAIELRPTANLTRENLGHALLCCGRTDEAIAEYKYCASKWSSMKTRMNQYLEIANGLKKQSKPRPIRPMEVATKTRMGMSHRSRVARPISDTDQMASNFSPDSYIVDESENPMAASEGMGEGEDEEEKEDEAVSRPEVMEVLQAAPKYRHAMKSRMR